ncbi:hypothetical protein SLS60_002964 [Paraconiothyrium brasiliense]|uniref:Uncharacterized protein n=1 Tax=Paraconiothyrium brasiliense TaxID=300254 RepID=A0ABR3RUE4_9PLEO
MTARGCSRSPSQRPQQFNMRSDPAATEVATLYDPAGLSSGMASEQMARDQDATTPGVPTVCDWDIDPLLLEEDEETSAQPLSKDEAILASELQSFNRSAFPASTPAPSPVFSMQGEANIDTNIQQEITSTLEQELFGDAPTTLDATMQSHYRADPAEPSYLLTPDTSFTFIPPVDHNIWEDVTAEHETGLFGHEMLPFSHGTGPDDPEWFQNEATPGAEGLPFDPSLPDNYTALTVPTFGPTSNISTFLEFDGVLGEDMTFFTQAIMAGDDEVPTDQAPSSEQLDGTSPLFQVVLHSELPRPSMEELDAALRDAKIPDHSIRQAMNLARRAQIAHSQSSHADTSNVMAALPTPPTMPPRKKLKLEHHANPTRGSTTPVNYHSITPASGLIRDAAEPHPDDYSTGALIYRVATSPLGIQFPFTIKDHFDMIGGCLHDQFVIELNRKLRHGLDLHGLSLIRNLSQDDAGTDEKLYRIIGFTKKGLQAQIDWTFCTEHLDLLGRLNMDDPDLDLEDMDRLVKATGVWHVQQWQLAHPGQDRGAH